MAIVIPGRPSNNTPLTSVDEDGGVVITPDPSGIVIKTRLMKESPYDQSNGSYVPPSLSSITTDGGPSENNDAKIFINVCTHPIIAEPGKRKGLDEETGKEIDGWRLPMSMGDLRPCYDKSGKAAIVADVILSKTVTQEMNSDPNHFQFVCDLVVQCASRKFGRTVFGGHFLDRRFKMPKMKYAGYVDEATGLPIVPGDGRQEGLQKPVVAKQRVKGHGGKSAIIEEVETPTPLARPKVASIEPPKAECRIELVICSSDGNSVPLFDFLSLAADHDGIAPKNYPSTTLREVIKSPKLKPNEEKVLHESQLLIAPMPFDATTLSLDQEELKTFGPNADLDEESGTVDYILAKCTVNTTAPTIELSAFMLLLLTDNNASKTECILPFPVNSRKTTTRLNGGLLEIRMPLLVVDSADPGTRQWDIENASARSNKSIVHADARGRNMAVDESEFSRNNSYADIFEADGKYPDDDNEPLPEDAFHSQDVLSRHFIKQQEDERKERANKQQGRGGADVEYLNIDDFRSEPQKTTENRDDSGPAKVVTSMMKLGLV